MAINSYGRLKTPPIHPEKRTQDLKKRDAVEQQRDNSIEEKISSLPVIDQDYMYEVRKQSQHKELLLGAYLTVIRKFDFLPKHILLTGFQDAVRHIYSANEAEEKQKKEEEKFCKKAERLVNYLQEEI